MSKRSKESFDLPTDFKTIHLGHDNIRDDQIRAHFFDQVKALVPILCRKDMISFGKKRTTKNLGLNWTIFNDYDSGPGSLHARPIPRIA